MTKREPLLPRLATRLILGILGARHWVFMPQLPNGQGFCPLIARPQRSSMLRIPICCSVSCRYQRPNAGLYNTPFDSHLGKRNSSKCGVTHRPPLASLLPGQSHCFALHLYADRPASNSRSAAVNGDSIRDCNDTTSRRPSLGMV